MKQSRRATPPAKPIAALLDYLRKETSVSQNATFFGETFQYRRHCGGLCQLINMAHVGALIDETAGRACLRC